MDDRVKHLIGFYDAQILSVYRNDGHRYDVESNNYAGEIRGEGIHIKLFGYRALRDGHLALAVWQPDIQRANLTEKNKWSGFRIVDEDLFTEESTDTRFLNWYNTVIEGSWNEEQDIIYELKQSLEDINAVTECAYEHKLFSHTTFEELKFPGAQSDHAYQDAHSKVYGIFIDGLSKDCLKSMESMLAIQLHNKPDNGTRKALKEILSSSDLDDCLEIVSKHRKLSDHNVRPSAQPYDAFNQFNSDLNKLCTELKSAMNYLARKANVDIESCKERIMRLHMKPKLDNNRKTEAHYSINNIRAAIGKKIERIEYGFREPYENVHDSEMMTLYFDDGSEINIDTGSNVGFGLENMRPEDVHISFSVNVVPATKKYS